ncbi:MAG: hypothetical protein RIA08_03440 [Roseovarius sp.]|uniref:hypothetical protein n=1 Tax=Roseovarius sp. TaxID=1486281 RepID=UPI0032EA9E00
MEPAQTWLPGRDRLFHDALFCAAVPACMTPGIRPVGAPFQTPVHAGAEGAARADAIIEMDEE